jgi:hypothetical protein
LGQKIRLPGAWNSGFCIFFPVFMSLFINGKKAYTWYDVRIKPQDIVYVKAKKGFF